ncbi:hypothetical protein GGD57_004955 [Rhizobium esperanzae]|uniref:Aldehyde dehydrogenase domain-containing protein n=1 Tax=Rhizobium esperanzae TaxID=1967781 RepID=A0A7W6R8M0_9HYPH|nr:hypothetical protein [Rhizobium esperanzae]
MAEGHLPPTLTLDPTCFCRFFPIVTSQTSSIASTPHLRRRDHKRLHEPRHGGSLRFGGVGHSGMDAYHGKFGFLVFSHPRAVCHRAVCHQSKMAEHMMRPPFAEAMRGFLAQAICKQSAPHQAWRPIASAKGRPST